MQVFHGTNIKIEQPTIINRFKTLDFGEGFYTTENENQARDFAIKVCERRSPPLFPVVNCYEFNEDLNNFSVLKFESPDEKWYAQHIPQIITEIKVCYNDEEETAIREFYKSNLFDKLQNPATGLWHLSSKTLSQIFVAETKEQVIEFPEEQS